jgi:hypothetical protein
MTGHTRRTWQALDDNEKGQAACRRDRTSSAICIPMLLVLEYMWVQYSRADTCSAVTWSGKGRQI